MTRPGAAAAPILPLLLLLATTTLAPGQADSGWFIVLGEEQLLDDARAFGRFAKIHRKANRGEIRADAVARLEKIAEVEQPKLLKALGSPADARPLWIVNAVAVRLDADGVARARKLDGVRAVFPAGSMPAGDAGKVEEVLEPAKREPFTTKGKKIGWHLEQLRVVPVWKKLGVTGEGALVVSIDQGLNYLQKDLRGSIWINEGEIPNNGKDDDGNGLTDDLYGFDFARMRAEVRHMGKRQHGSWTSCVIVGDGTGGTITGVAPRAKLMPLIAFGGPYLAARALQYAVKQEADVVSMSFSIPGLGQARGLWRLMAEHATCAGLVLVSGAGNFQQTAKIPVQIRIPEGIPCVVCVGGVNRKLKVPSFVRLGPVEWESVDMYGDHPMPKGLVKPDVVAFPGPGLPLVSIVNEGYLPENNGRYGNSLSAPQVAGVCALMLSANPDLTPFSVK